MAVDPTKAKRDINFDTFAPEKEGSRINWFEQAKTISDAFTKVATDRQKRKDDIDADTKKNLDALNELESLDNKTLMDMTIDGSNNAANVIYNAEQAMKRGELRPQDFQKLKNNISSGFTQFQKNAKSWDADFKRYTDRMNGVDGQQSSSLEQYLGQRMEAFGNLKNLQLVTNPETGMLAFGRIDPETGELLTGPDDLISMNRMTAISKQEINEYNVSEFIEQASSELGDFITAGNASTMGKDGTGPRAVLTIEDFMQTPEAEKYITDKAKAAMSSNYEIGSILADNGITNDDGELFRAGDQRQFDQWNEDNPGNEDNNPIIVMGYKENGVQVEPAITEAQRKKARLFLEDSLKAKLGYKETLVTKQQLQERPESAYQIAKGEKDEEADASGQSVNLLVTGTAVEAEAASKDLISSFEDLTDIDRVVDKDGKVTSFNIKIKDKVVDPISAFDAEGNPKTPDQLNREIFKLVGAPGTYDAWKKRNNVGENIGEGASSSSEAAAEINYNLPADMVVVGDSKITYDAFFSSDSGGTLGSTLAEHGFSSDGEADVQQGFTNLLGSPSFIPKGLKDFISKEGGEIKVQVGTSGGVADDQMIITIGNEVIKYDDVYADATTGGTVGIAQKIREAIEREVKRANTGGSTTNTNTTKQAPSDVRLKKNISKVGVSPNGYNIYNFEYINQSKYGSGVYQGVMAQEVPHAQIEVGDYYHVDYDKLDVTFKKI